MGVEIASRPIPFAMQKDDGRSTVSSLQNVKNVIVEETPQAESPYALIFSPGLRPFAQLPEDSGPVLGDVVVSGQSYVCTARALWKVGENAFSRVADHTVVGRVSMAHDGENIMYVDGYRTYTYNVVTGDHDLIDIDPSNTVTWQDGYFIVMKRATNQWAVSDIGKTTFNPLQFASAEGSPDNILAVLSDHREVWIFGEETTEVWYNSGADFPFDPIQGAFMEKGIAAVYAHTKANNTVYWLGHDRIVYAAAGYQPQRISTFSIEEALEGADLEDSWMETYTQEGHIFIWFTIPSIKKTFVFDTSNGLWAERTSLSEGRHIANTMFDLNGQTIVGDFRNGALYAFDLDWPFDGESEMIERDAILPPLFNNGNRVKQSMFELKMQNISSSIRPTRKITGVWTADNTCVTADSTEETADGWWPNIATCCPGLPSAQDKPMIGLSMTDNHGQTWTPFQYIPAGVQGQTEARWRWWRLGSFYERSFRIRMVAPYTGVWIGAYIG